MSSTYIWLGLPAIVIFIGGLITSFWHPKKEFIALVQHFAAGIILAALTTEVFPAMESAHVPHLELIISFIVGTFFMFGVKKFGSFLERENSPNAIGRNFNFGFIITVFIDAMLDGLTIGAGFAAGEKIGVTLALGLSVEMLFLGMSLLSDTIKGKWVIILSAGLSFAILLSAGLGYYFLANASHDIIACALAFSAAALLYLVTEELLVEAHKHEETEFSMLVLFAGFILFWAISIAEAI